MLKNVPISTLIWFYITNFVNNIRSCYLGRRPMSLDLFGSNDNTFKVLVDV